MPLTRAYRAGESLEDLCRACKADRLAHGYCSRRGRRAHSRGLRILPQRAQLSRQDPRCRGRRRRLRRGARDPRRTPASRAPFPIVSERERTSTMPVARHLRISKYCCGGSSARKPESPRSSRPTNGAAGRWCCVRAPPACRKRRGPSRRSSTRSSCCGTGSGRSSSRSTRPICRTAKVKLQSYVSGCYGSLTSFNVLFADEDDQFKGSGGD